MIATSSSTVSDSNPYDVWTTTDTYHITQRVTTSSGTIVYERRVYPSGQEVGIHSWDGGTGDQYVITSDYYSPPSNPLDEAIEDFKKALTARNALFWAWNKEVQRDLFKMSLDKAPFPGRTLERLCYSRERRAMPVRQLFKKRVCGGHQRYRVMRPV